MEKSKGRYVSVAEVVREASKFKRFWDIIIASGLAVYSI
jgi:hypothetical protein